jgi:hypothetical protein
MKKTMLLLLFCFAGLLLTAQTTFRLKAFERSYIGGIAPTPAIEPGGKEIPATVNNPQPEYFIYVLNKKNTTLRTETVWIKKRSYPVSTKKLSWGRPVLIDNITMKKDTLIANKDSYIWQIKITGGSKKVLVTKDLSRLVKENELVVKLRDSQGRYYTRSVKNITRLEPERGQ